MTKVSRRVGIDWGSGAHQVCRIDGEEEPKQRGFPHTSEGLNALVAFVVEGDIAPEHVLMTNRHHDRHAWRLRDAFGCSVHCIRNGLHELAGRGPVEAFDFGDELPGGVVVFEVDAICPDETALHLPAHCALACADGVVRWPGGDELAFVPDRFMDAPERTKAGLR